MNDSKDHKAAAEPPLDCRVGLQTLAAKIGYTPLLCALGLHRWSITSGSLDLDPDGDGLKWTTTGYLCKRCGASKDVTTVAEWPNA